MEELKNNQAAPETAYPQHFDTKKEQRSGLKAPARLRNFGRVNSPEIVYSAHAAV